LTTSKQFQKALEVADTINPPSARDAAETKELRLEALSNIRRALNEDDPSGICVTELGEAV